MAVDVVFRGPISVCAPAGYDLPSVVACLEHEGVQVHSVIAPRVNQSPAVPDGVTACFLVHPESAHAIVADTVASLRPFLAEGLALVVCTSDRSAADRRMFGECGASDVIVPRSWAPEHVAERLLAALTLRGEVAPRQFGALFGAAPCMHRLYEEIEQVARFPDPVLIVGETGSGKELVARELQARSRRDGGLLAVNCAELEPQVLGSELFGHERGSFTGAEQRREGLLMAAGAGTLFLDEIGDAPLAVQAKLLRAIECREVRPIGANRPVEMKARVVLGTHRDLGAESEGGRFRSDLLYRIAGVTLRVPPLRERRSDVPLLAQHFLDVFNAADDGSRIFPGGGIDRLMAYHWPGNVRELRAVVRRAAMSTEPDGGSLRLPTLREAPAKDPVGSNGHSVPFDPETDTWDGLEERALRTYLRALLSSVGGDRARAISKSGISRTQFYQHLRKLKLGE